MVRNVRSFYMVLPYVVAILKNKKGGILVGRQPFQKHKPYPGL
jgi:hypothetical protein